MADALTMSAGCGPDDAGGSGVLAAALCGRLRSRSLSQRVAAPLAAARDVAVVNVRSLLVSAAAKAIAPARLGPDASAGVHPASTGCFTPRQAAAGSTRIDAS